jgi:hypothetical protein
VQKIEKTKEWKEEIQKAKARWLIEAKVPGTSFLSLARKYQYILPQKYTWSRCHCWSNQGKERRLNCGGWWRLHWVRKHSSHECILKTIFF